MSELYNKYFDSAASYPISELVRKKLPHYYEKYFANPSSVHTFGKSSNKAITNVKNEFRDLLDFQRGTLLFNSGGTEANNTILTGVLRKYPHKKILISEDSHDSCWYITEHFPKNVEIIPMNKDGMINLTVLEKKLKNDIILCSILHGNNETGIIQDITAIREITTRKSVKLHIDAVQTIGHSNLSLDTLNCDFVTFAAHKFGGVKGAGGIFIQSNDFLPLVSGGSQENNLRGGTENTVAIVASLDALNYALSNLSTKLSSLTNLRDTILKILHENNVSFSINTPLENSLAHLLSLSFEGLQGSEIVQEMSILGYAISTGSACHANEVKGSRIIKALGHSEKYAQGTIRISLHTYLTQSDCANFSQTLSQVVKRQYKYAGL